jgi:hypothetical protein
MYDFHPCLNMLLKDLPLNEHFIVNKNSLQVHFGFLFLRWGKGKNTTDLDMYVCRC